MGVFIILELSLNEPNSVNFQRTDMKHHFLELSEADVSYDVLSPSNPEILSKT